MSLVFIPLIFVNLWHGLVIWWAKKQGKVWRSISESASASPQSLLVHRIVHIAGAGCFYGYAWWLWHNPMLVWPATVLAIAATCDIGQVLSLSPRTKHAQFDIRDVHQAGAWTMAAGYMVFASAVDLTALASVAYIALLA